MHVLLVEPDRVLADAYIQALRHADHTVAHAVNAQTAIDAADTQMPHIVVLELQLPAHGGVEFLYEFRSYAEWLHIPVIIHSNIPPQELHDVRDTFEKALGVRAFLYKPSTTLRQLLRTVHDAAGGIP